MTTYTEFLARKGSRTVASGPEVADADLHPFLRPDQRHIVRWSTRLGRAAIWADTGYGKTVMELEWARLSGRRSLILAPLAVCHQTVREAAKVGLSPRYLREDDGRPGIIVTNYEISDHFDASTFDAVVLDESSVIKDVTTKTRDRLIAQFRDVPRRLDCSATPAPNDLAELANHAEFLGHATRREMLSTYFVHDQDGWRVKGHARGPMFRWMASWAIAARRPSDLGYPDGDYRLPPLDITADLLPVDVVPDDQLFATDLGGVGGRARIRRATAAARCARAADLIRAEAGESWIAWCGLNDEARTIARAVPGAVNVEGSWPDAGDVSAAGLARYYAVSAFEWLARAHGDAGSPVYMARLAGMCAEFSAAVALAALADPGSPPLFGPDGFGATSPGELAAKAATQIRDILEEGDSTGEWLLEFLGKDTCDEVTRLVTELDALLAEKAAAGADSKPGGA